MNEDAPCRYCTKRCAACHDRCAEYKAWKERYQAQLKYLDENKYSFGVPQTASRARTRRNHLDIV
jgi:hypothetical protein